MNRFKLLGCILKKNWLLLVIEILLIAATSILCYYINMNAYILGLLSGVLSSSIVSIVCLLAGQYQSDIKVYSRIAFFIDYSLKQIGFYKEENQINFVILKETFTNSNYVSLLIIASELKIPSFFTPVSNNYKAIVDCIGPQNSVNDKVKKYLDFIEQNCKALPKV